MGDQENEHAESNYFMGGIAGQTIGESQKRLGR
jgi:hypothetical protein